jgi:type IV pilus biogenesis protein CpaD/CtpE
MTLRSLCTLAILAATAVAASGCIKASINMPDERSIGYDGKNLVPPDCSQMERPSLLLDAGLPRPSVQWGCATYTNLAAQIANPQDFVEPQPLGPADAAVAASAVHRYQTGRVTPLDQSTSRSSK